MRHDVGLHQMPPFTPGLEAEPIAEPNMNRESSSSIRDVSTKINPIQDGCILYSLLGHPGRVGLRATRHIDPVGNIFARRRERENDLPGFPVGGHLATQIAGGMYDGELGVLSAPEIVRTPNDNGIKTLRPIEAVSWTSEEGAPLQPPMTGSDVSKGVQDRLGVGPKG